jgi:Na+/citrate or Na+/malate symporter
MISFDKPNNLDGAKLIDELIAVGVEIIGSDQFAHLGKTPPSLDGNGKLFLSIDAKDQAKAQTVIDAHNG